MREHMENEKHKPGDTVAISVDEYEYLKQHHAITEEHIGVAKVRLKKACYAMALKELDECCESLNKITIKHCPATARLCGLINK